jgi:hypothetical protein
MGRGAGASQADSLDSDGNGVVGEKITMNASVNCMIVMNKAMIFNNSAHFIQENLILSEKIT